MVALLNKVDCPYENFQKVKIFIFKMMPLSLFWLILHFVKKKKKKINHSFRVGKEWRAISAPKPQFW